MDFDLIEKLDENQINEFFNDYIGNNTETEEESENKLAAHWSCYVYVRQSSNIMSNLRYRIHYVIDGYIFGFYSASNEEWDITKIVWDYTFYYKPSSSETYSYIAPAISTKAITCTEIYDCFEKIYEQNFRPAEHCGKVGNTSPDYNSDWYGYYNYHKGGGDTHLNHMKTTTIKVWATERDRHFGHSYESTYECNIEDQNYFYRTERTNELYFNANFELSEYIVNENFNHFDQLQYHGTPKFRFYNVIDLNTTQVKDNYGQVYIHMGCNR